MNVHSLFWPMSQPQIDTVLDRPTQILDAAVACFAKRGFHQASMHDISAEAGISVGLIYRYFQNKEAVISAMADRHKQEIHEILERARQAPGLLESLEVLFTAHCGETEPQVVSAFVVDLFAEASRNTHIAELVRDVCETSMNGVTDLIARSPEAKATNLTPREIGAQDRNQGRARSSRSVFNFGRNQGTPDFHDGQSQATDACRNRDERASE